MISHSDLVNNNIQFNLYSWHSSYRGLFLFYCFVYCVQFIAWESAVRNTVNNQSKPLEHICSKHFSSNDVITKYSQTPSDIIMPEALFHLYLIKEISQPLLMAKSACESPTHNIINNQLKSSKDICSKKETPDYVINKYSPTPSNVIVPKNVSRTTSSAINQKNIFQTSLTAESFRIELFPASTVTLKINIDCIYPTVTDAPHKQICLVDLQCFLMNWLTRGGLIHPSTFLFNLLSTVEEESFQKFCNNYDVFQQTINNFSNEKLKIINTYPM
ncbi:hypothetical protein QTP88_017668 [Uroleucon formosanum]